MRCLLEPANQLWPLCPRGGDYARARERPGTDNDSRRHQLGRGYTDWFGGRIGATDVSGRLTVGELARRTGTTPKTIRFYEQIGLLPLASRGANGYRYFDESQIQPVRFIRRAERLGLSLAEIGQIMELARENRCNELRSSLEDVFDRKIREYEFKVTALRTLKAALRPEDEACVCRPFVPDCDCLPSAEIA